MRYGDVPEKITSKVERVGGCWIWTGATARGRPHVRFRGSTTSGQRASYELMVGRVPEGMNVSTTCGDRLCVNPEHLTTRSQSDIAYENVPRLAFTDRDVAAMAALYRQGFSTQDIAANYGCLPGSVWQRLKDCGVDMRPRGTRKHGWCVTSHGYVKFGQQYLHRLVFEAWHGRRLADDEHVHHVDGDKTNNHPDNLRSMSASEHHRLHYQDRETDKTGRFI